MGEKGEGKSFQNLVFLPAAAYTQPSSRFFYDNKQKK